MLVAGGGTTTLFGHGGRQGWKAAATCQHGRLATVSFCNLPGEPDGAAERLAGEPEPLLGGGLDDVACEEGATSFGSGQRSIFGYKKQAARRRANLPICERSPGDRVSTYHPLQRLLPLVVVVVV